VAAGVRCGDNGGDDAAGERRHRGRRGRRAVRRRKQVRVRRQKV
jgi:hypothetical protein